MNLNVDLRTLAARIVELYGLQDVMQLATPDGRWQSLQKWLKQNPDWKRQLNTWIQSTPEEAYSALQRWIAEEAEIPLAMLKLVISREVEGQIKPIIAQAQELYRERAAMDGRKEIAG